MLRHSRSTKTLSMSSHNVKDFLARNQIPYQWMDIESDAEAGQLVEAVNKDEHRLPVVFFPNGSVLIEPDNRTLAEKVGLQTQATQAFYDLIIVGGGPAGLGAAVYAGSEGLRVSMIEKEATGGQAGTSSFIENYLGFPKGLSGADLTRRTTAQAQRFGVEILTTQEATQVRVADPYRFVILSDGTELSCHALLIATGVSVRTLDVPGIEAVTGAGVHYGAALTEAVHYRDQHVFVIGGANSAGQGAMFFSRHASQVTMVVRADSIEAPAFQLGPLHPDHCRHRLGVTRALLRPFPHKPVCPLLAGVCHQESLSTNQAPMDKSSTLPNRTPPSNGVPRQP